jgi:hypothetical protein
MLGEPKGRSSEMMKTVEVKHVVSGDADALWQIIRTGKDVNTWLAAIATCEVKGAQRYCTMAGGGDLEETIVEVDDKPRRFAYRVDKHPLPIGVMNSVMEVREVSSNKTEITWRSAFDADEAAYAQVAPMLQNLFMAGITGLEAHITPKAA